MFAQPGKKLLFQGAEVAQWDEWNHEASVDWHLLGFERHRGVRDLLVRLNDLYRHEPALHSRDCEPQGYEWVDGGDAANSVLSFLRRGDDPNDDVLVVCNFTPLPRSRTALACLAPGSGGRSSTATRRSTGAGWGNMGGVRSSPTPWHGRTHSVSLTLPPLSALMLRRERGEG